MLIPNCSEAVFRLNKLDYEKYKGEIDNIIEEQRLSFESAGPEYSPQEIEDSQIGIFDYQITGLVA